MTLLKARALSADLSWNLASLQVKIHSNSGLPLYQSSSSSIRVVIRENLLLICRCDIWSDSAVALPLVTKTCFWPTQYPLDVIFRCSQTQKKSKRYFLSRPLCTKIPFTTGDLLVGKWLDMCMLDDGLLLHHGTQMSWGMDQSKKNLE